MAQAASSSLPLSRTSRKIKPKVDPDFEYDYVQQRIDQLDRELAASGSGQKDTRILIKKKLSQSRQGYSFHYVW